MAAVILAFAVTGCIAFSAVSDLVSNFLSLVVMVIARIILQFCDLIMNPLLEITQMTTEEIAHYIPGFAMSGDGIGGYFSQAITVISTTIAGALIAVRIISYLMETADGARTESVPKLIWNAVFGMVLTLTGSHFLQLMFDEIISPLTTALSEGVTGGGLGEFSFEDSGMKIIDQTESGDAAGTIVAWMGGFSIVEGASLVVSVVFLFLIWWNLIKLVLECAERYIICVFTILLSPLAFATATNERTKDTAVNWMQMFWSQCVLLILNIWVVGIARTALNIGLVGASVESVVKWGLVTYAYLKIAQKLDDMLAKAGFRITSTTGLDPSNAVKVTIPMSVKAQKPFISSLQYAELSEEEKRGFFTLKEDDIIVKGTVALDEISLEAINSNYEEKMVIKSVDTFDFGNLQHWQVGGA